MKKNKKWANLSIILVIIGIILIAIPLISDVVYGSGLTGSSSDGDSVELPESTNNNAGFPWKVLCEILGFVCFIGSMFSGLKHRKVI